MFFLDYVLGCHLILYSLCHNSAASLSEVVFGEVYQLTKLLEENSSSLEENSSSLEEHSSS